MDLTTIETIAASQEELLFCCPHVFILSDWCAISQRNDPHLDNGIHISKTIITVFRMHSFLANLNPPRRLYNETRLHMCMLTHDKDNNVTVFLFFCFFYTYYDLANTKCAGCVNVSEQSSISGRVHYIHFRTNTFSNCYEFIFSLASSYAPNIGLV